MPEYDAHPLPDPDGCAHCGLAQRGHYRRWDDYAEWHKWTAPSNRTRLARMKARRALRLAPRQSTPIPDELILTITAEDTLTPAIQRLITELDPKEA